MVRSRRAQLPPSLTDAARSAPFVLVGTARHPRQSTVKELPGDREDTVVVRVEEVIDAPPGVQLAGRDVTIRLSGRSLRRGLRAVFFATSRSPLLRSRGSKAQWTSRWSASRSSMPSWRRSMTLFVNAFGERTSSSWRRSSVSDHCSNRTRNQLTRIERTGAPQT
jgi:hypothetical protein